MTPIDWLLIGLLLCAAGVHLYFGTRYREFFVVGRTNLHQSYWYMIQEFQKHHPKPGKVLISVVWLQGLLVVALALSRFIH